MHSYFGEIKQRSHLVLQLTSRNWGKEGWERSQVSAKGLRYQEQPAGCAQEWSVRTEAFPKGRPRLSICLKKTNRAVRMGCKWGRALTRTMAVRTEKWGLSSSYWKGKISKVWWPTEFEGQGIGREYKERVSLSKMLYRYKNNQTSREFYEFESDWKHMPGARFPMLQRITILHLLLCI